MFRLVHVFDLKPGQNEENFITWLDATLFEQARKFGCLERKTWVFLDGLEEPYGKAKKVTNRPKYINEAFWEGQEGAEKFRQWLLSGEGMKHRQRWNESVMNHSVLRYVDYAPPQNLSDD
jgi:hypothetical protein